MFALTVSSKLGTVALEALIVDLLKALKLDKDGDGKVSKSEIFQAISELAPQFFNFGDVMDEGRDLDATEFQHLCNVAAANMPDYPNVRAEAETVVRAALETIGSAAKLIVAVTRLGKAKPETPAPVAKAAPAAPAKTPDQLQAAKDKTAGK